MPGTFDRMKKHFSLCAQHLQQFKACLSTKGQFTMLLDSIPETTERWMARGWQAPCEMCLTSRAR